MAAILKCSDLSREHLRELLEALNLPQGEACRIWAETPDGWTLDYWHGVAGDVRWYASRRRATAISGSQCIATASSGRVFAPSGELRWRAIDALGCCRTVFLGDSDWVAERLTDRSALLQPLRSATARYFLWGQQTDVSNNDWVELRIPHRFRYPIAGRSKGVCVVTELWRDGEGDLHFARLCDLEPYEEDD